MKYRLTAFAFILVMVILTVAVYRDRIKSDHTKLTIYAYSSFTTSWGAGPKIISAYKANCSCDVELIDAGDAGLLLQKLILEKDSPRADVVVGLDQMTIKEALEKLKFLPINKIQIPKGTPSLPAEAYLGSAELIPYDWAPMGFIYKKSRVSNPPVYLNDLLKPEFKGKIAIQDPRTSTPGMQFLSWILAAKGEAQAKSFLTKLKANEVILSPSWSTAYGLFKKDQADLVFSYFTSPSYHELEEHSDDYAAASFVDAHVYQVEYAGILANAPHSDKARDFMEYLLSYEAQNKLMYHNFMLPVYEEVKKDTPFTRVITPKLIPNILKMQQSLDKPKAVELWKSVFH